MIRAGYNTGGLMYWETKLEELQKLAPVVFESPERGKWIARFLTMVKHDNKDAVDAFPVCEGSTLAGSVVGLWAEVATGEPFIVIVTGQPVRRVRWNAGWETLDLPKTPEMAVIEEQPAPVIEVAEVDEPEPGSFDPAD